jgi:hypothetical protein
MAASSSNQFDLRVPGSNLALLGTARLIIAKAKYYLQGHPQVTLQKM